MLVITNMEVIVIIEPDFLKRKERIIINAIEILNEVGVNGLTSKEIAKRENVSEPAIYRHFNGKKEIIKSIINRYSSFDNLIRNTIIDNKITGKPGIEYFCKSYAEYYQNYPQITTVLFSFDTFKYDNDTNEEMKIIVKKRYDFLFNLVSEAIENNEVSSNYNTEALTDIIFGVIWSTTFLWRMEDCNFNVKDRIMTTIDKVLS